MFQNKAILHVVCTFPPYSSGIGFSALKQAKLGQKMGYNITVITPNYDKNEDFLDSIANIKVIRKKPLFTMGKAGFINTSKAISHNDIIHIHYPFYFSILTTIFNAKIKNKKILLYWHMNPEDIGLKGLFFKFYEKYILAIILKLSDKILVSTYDYFENGTSCKTFKKFKNKIQELPFSVNAEKFQPREKNLELIKKYNLNNKKILLFVGGLDRGHYFKGVDILLESFSKLNLDEYKLIIIGDGDLKDDYKNLTKKLKIETSVIFLDNIKNDELPIHYNLADVLILPSINKGEAFGIVQIEAMASGIPVIVSNLPGVRKVLENGITGFIFENKNIEDLKLKIEDLFKSDEKYKQMKIDARERVNKNFSEKIILEKLQNIYEICLINNLYYPDKRGGAEEMVYLLANELKKQKHKVFVVCSSDEYKKTTSEKIDNIDVYRIGYEKYFPYLEINKQNIVRRFFWRINQLKNKYSANTIYSILNKEKPDLVLSHNTLALGYNIIKTINNYCKIKKIKHITTIHDVQLIYSSGILKPDDIKRGFLLKIYSFFTKNIYSSCKNIVFPSNALLKIYTKNGFFRKNNVFTINNPIKIESLNIQKTKSHKLRLIYLGQLEEHKGVMDLIKTIRQLDPEKFHLTIAGRGSLVEKINKSTYIVNNVDYAGEFDENKRIKLLKDADVVVVPSICFENSPMIIYEAFLSETPVLASNIGGIPELVINDETGWLFKAGNTENLKAKLLEIYDKKDNLDDIQKNCLKLIKQFDIKNYIKKILEIH